MTSSRLPGARPGAYNAAMKNLQIGVQILERTVPATIDSIVHAEEAGLDAVWMTVGGAQPDAVAVYAAAAMRTDRIKMGTSIVPTYPRHPFALAQEARAVGELAPGRFRLGVGPSHRPVMEGTWGLRFRKPLTHLREYLHLLRATIQQGGRVEFSGEFFNVRADWGEPLDVPVMASGLRSRAFQVIGEMADGGITWVTPLNHVRNVAIPAMEAAAARAGRPRPAMVMHVGVAVHEDADEVREAAMRQFGFYPRLPFYSSMFVEAGFPEAAEGGMSRAMLDAIIIHGDQTAVAGRLREIAAAGVDEVICSVVGAGTDRRASAGRTRQALGELARAD